MRLTLRTLLAYLDDTLEPEQAKSIGQKVAESPVAQELVERIKKVTRRRSLGNPPVNGDTSRLDANTVAEYLDSTLGADELSQVEQTCLDDDVYLAEVAACHQILTLMLSEPARVPPPARQRMYRLVQGRESSPYRRPPAYFPAPHSRRRGIGHDEPHPGRFLRYLLTALVLALGLAVSIALAWPRSEPTRSQSHVETVFQQPVTVVQPPTKPLEPEKKVDAAAAPATNDKPKRQMPEPTPPAAAVAPEAPPKKAIDRVPVIEPSNERREIGTFVSPLSVLITQREPAEPWLAVRLNGRVAASDRLIALPGYRSEVKLDSGVQVMLWGNLLEFLPWLSALESLATLHIPADKLDADVTLDHGRIVLTNSKGEAPARVRLRFRSEVWDLTLAAKSEVLVDGLLSYEPGARFSKDAGGDTPLTQLFVGVIKGKTSVQIRDFPPYELSAPPGPAIIGWDNKTRVKEPLLLARALPQWSTELSTKTPVPDFKAILDRLQTRLAGDRSTVELVLAELAQDDKPYVQAYAGYALPAIDAISPVADALDDLTKPNMRGAAILALRHWVTRQPDNGVKLYTLLIEKKKYSEAQAAAVLQLLHSFSQQDVLAPATYEQFFVWLNDEKLSVRELAYWHLGQLDPEGRKQSMYNPTMTDGRETAVARWRKRLTEGKLPPKPPKSAGNGAAEKTK